MDIAATLRTPGGQIGFLLMCGYFKATKRYYQPQDFHERDIEFAARVLKLKGSDFSRMGHAVCWTICSPRRTNRTAIV